MSQSIGIVCLIDINRFILYRIEYTRHGYFLSFIWQKRKKAFNKRKRLKFWVLMKTATVFKVFCKFAPRFLGNANCFFSFGELMRHLRWTVNLDLRVSNSATVVIEEYVIVTYLHYINRIATFCCFFHSHQLRRGNTTCSVLIFFIGTSCNSANFGKKIWGLKFQRFALVGLDSPVC